MATLAETARGNNTNTDPPGKSGPAAWGRERGGDADGLARAPLFCMYSARRRITRRIPQKEKAGDAAQVPARLQGSFNA